MLGLIAGAIALLFVGFGAGWGVKSWKDSAEIAMVSSQKSKLESRNATLSASNDNCAIDIDGVRNGVTVVSSKVEEAQCAAIVQEQKDYVQSHHP
jgi:hypothetical protein